MMKMILVSISCSLPAVKQSTTGNDKSKKIAQSVVTDDYDPYEHRQVKHPTKYV